MSDGVLMGDVIAAGAEDDFAEGRVGIEIQECGPNLCLSVGPFQPGGAKRMLDQMELPGMGVSIAKLADRFEVVDGDDGEFISIEISPGRRQRPA